MERLVVQVSVCVCFVTINSRTASELMHTDSLQHIVYVCLHWVWNKKAGQGGKIGSNGLIYIFSQGDVATGCKI